ncbi:hypothetical protein F889_00213 [Acinetobacter colistiniresistens]|uniref:Uncharacterized protein n=1 Tax=Acinetobacter colistiniresistens TaxID=280145 RepID=N9PSG9_9GAMM|nr:hypothetical protein [Acinetobacter colistiniresistens]ENX36499.1 hypothetical protein F889_00213 [Acinetobacter colistiniresistens]
MLINKMVLGTMILLGAFTCFSASVLAAPLQILEFKKGQLSATEQTQLCEHVKELCPTKPQWLSLKTPDQSLWLLSEGNIAQFSHSNSGFMLLKQWKIPLAPAEEMARSKQYIYPKLFPMDQNRYAVALIDTLTESYSGGGASVERASFYELQNSGQTHRFIERYPFNFYRMIRACFSEQDYENSNGKCHDEDSLGLDIRPIRPMLWQFRYRYSLDVSPASDSGEKSFKGSRNLNIDLNKAPEQPNIPAEWDYEGAG